MTRAFVVALLTLALLVPVTATGAAGSASDGTGATAAKKKRKKCKKGYVRKRVKIKKGKNKGKRVSKCVKKKKKKKKKAAAPVLPSTTDGGVFAGGAGPTEVRILFGYDSEAKPDEDGDGVSARLTIPPGAMSCTGPTGTYPSDQPFRANWDGTIISKKAGTFRGSDSSFGVTHNMQGRFLPRKRFQVTVSITGASASSKGGQCSGSASRDVTYKAQPAGSFSNP